MGTPTMEKRKVNYADQRFCQWELESESVAEQFRLWYSQFYKTVWRKGCIVYWIELSTD